MECARNIALFYLQLFKNFKILTTLIVTSTDITLLHRVGCVLPVISVVLYFKTVSEMKSCDDAFVFSRI